MAVENRPSDAGAVSPPPSSTEYSSRGVFNTGDPHLAQSSGGSGSIADTALGPSGTTGGGGDVNDSTITLAGTNGIGGGGSFTTNQAGDGSITFNLTNLGTAGTFGTADNPVQSIEVDAQGRVVMITTQVAPPIPTPFNDQFSSTGNRNPRAASEMPETEMVTLNVGAGYTLSDITTTSTGNVPVTIGEPVLSNNDMTATIPVTIPATDEATDPLGDAAVTTTSTVTETDSGRTRTETAMPLDRNIFIPYYTTPTTTAARGGPANLGGFTASSAALTNGTPVAFTHPGPSGRQYAYLALERFTGRTYRFDAGFFDISTDPTGMTYTMFGRTFDLYEIPTNGDLSFTIRW